MNTHTPSGFARKSHSYDGHAHAQADAAKWLSEWLPATNHLSCLEFGAGTGLFSQYLDGRFAPLCCTDMSAEMLERCQQRLPNISTQVSNAWKAPQQTAPTWQLIVSSSLLQWAPDPVEVLRNWKCQLSPGGRILIGLFIDPSLKEMRAVYPQAAPFEWRSFDHWQQSARDAGLHILRSESREQVYHYPSALAFWRSLHDTGTTVSRKTPVGSLRKILRNYEATYRTPKGVPASWTTGRMELSVIE